MASGTHAYPTTLALHAIANDVKDGFDIADRTGLQTGTVYPSLQACDVPARRAAGVNPLDPIRIG